MSPLLSRRCSRVRQILKLMVMIPLGLTDTGVINPQNGDSFKQFAQERMWLIVEKKKINTMGGGL